MENKKIFFKWTFIFSILVIWSYLVITGLVIGSFSKDFNIPIYVQSSAGIEKAGSEDIIDILFNHNFDLEERIENVSEEKCSLRAKGSNLNINGNSFGYINSNLQLSSKNSKSGGGSLVAGDGKKRFSLNFKIKDVVKTDSQSLVLKASGEGKLNKEKVKFDSIEVVFDKKKNQIEINGKGDVNFESKDMNVEFIDGCLNQEKKFYLLKDNGKLGKKRTIGEVRKLLNEHPELIDMFEGLKGLYNDYWWLAIPGGIVSG